MSIGVGQGMGLDLSGPEREPTTVNTEAIDPEAPRSRRYRPAGPEEVAFPVAPMLDMAFQLLAFFILTFKSPSAETHIDLELPATPAALPAKAEGRAVPRSRRRADTDLENDLLVRAVADDLGDLKSLRLGEADVSDLPSLGRRLRRYTQLLEGRPLRVRIIADDRLRYEPAAQIIATCSSAHVASIRLSPPGATPALPGAAEPGPGGRGPATATAPARPGGSP
jgi:biopolymer transport protein ExbD